MLNSRRLLLALPVVVLFSIVVPGCKGRDIKNVGEDETPFVLVLSPVYGTDPENIERLRVFVQ